MHMMRYLSFFSFLALIGATFARTVQDVRREKVRQFCLGDWFEGMSPEISKELADDVGPSTVDYLEELLYDCRFERRDNVVAILGFLSNGEALEDAFLFGVCSYGTPGNELVELLLPHVLGHVARRGFEGAKRLFLDKMFKDGHDGALYQAAQRARNQERQLTRLTKQALLGLRECADSDPDLNDLLKRLASGKVAPTWIPQTSSSFNIAESSQRMISDMSPTKETPGSRNKKHNIFDRTHSRRRLGSDNNNDSHELLLDFVRHPDVDDSLTVHELDLALASITKYINDVDYSGDVGCCVTLSRDGDIGTFGSPGDDLDMITNEEDLRTVRDDPMARLKIVNYIGNCGGTRNINVKGCAKINGYGIVIVASSPRVESIGKLIGHEVGHNIGLNHPPDDNRQLMDPSLRSGPVNAVGLTQEQCDKFHNPSSDSQVTPVRLGGCPLASSLPTALTCNTGTLVDFESGSMENWINKGGSCTSGGFVVGKPVFEESRIGSSTMITTQVGGDHTTGTGYALFTDGIDGSEDVSGGECIVQSPEYYISQASSLSFWFFFGERDAGDDDEDWLRIQMSVNGGSWNNLVSFEDKNYWAEWLPVIIDMIPANSVVRLRIKVSDGPIAKDKIETGIDDIRICPLSTTCTTVDFENGMSGWTNNNRLSTCSTGTFVAAQPNRIVSGGVRTQVDGDHTTGDGKALFTAPNNNGNGKQDVDNGVCVVDSPVYDIDVTSSLSLYYFHGQRDTGDDSNDYFDLQISYNAGGSWTELVSNGDERSVAEWTQVRVETIPAGSQVKLRLRASDGAGRGDLVEAGIDDIHICPK